MAESQHVSLNVANFLRSLTQGDNSYAEAPIITNWTKSRECSDEEVENFSNILDSIKHFSHPIFFNVGDFLANGSKFDPNRVFVVTPTCDITTTELAQVISLPGHSLPDMPVIGCARFGRDVSSLDKLEGNIAIGNSYHMHHEDKNKPIRLNSQSLTMHTLVTGSTGSGKSNTIYQLLNKLCIADGGDCPVKFLVIEPAKGEYKNVFGGYDGVSVFGTNPDKMPLLQINPFSFPNDVHVLEHIDRLIEILNACWPMYAAMPAILKKSIETAYKRMGWSLVKSICAPRRFPTFESVIDELPRVISNTAYSADTIGDYTGALVTRVESLTTGIHRHIFCSDNETSESVLFDSNVIVDISRIGSSETKALIMGILIMKLQEYRMSSQESNSALRHLTVLEEAHNLLRRTSSEQTQESSNLQGKSVEMLANAISEMRSYGEGFIVADQSPGLLDMSVIRNTNTKIILRLPDESDRLLVGKSAGLNDNQIIELARLKVGVAAISQSNWIEPILCQVEEFKDRESFKNDRLQAAVSGARQHFFKKIAGMSDCGELSKEEIENIKTWVNLLNVGENTKEPIRKTLSGETITRYERDMIFYNIFEGKRIAFFFQNREDAEAIAKIDRYIAEKHSLDDMALAQNIRNVIVDVVRRELPQGELTDRIDRILSGMGRVL
jgi:hypothetical protein